MALKSSMERASKMAGGFATAKKNVVIQYKGRERMEQGLFEQIRKDILCQGMKDEEIEEVNIYIKPEESAVFYVVNNKIQGQIPFYNIKESLISYIGRRMNYENNYIRGGKPKRWYWKDNDSNYFGRNISKKRKNTAH